MSFVARSFVALVIVGLAAAALVVAVLGLSWAARSDRLAVASEDVRMTPSATVRTAVPTPRATPVVLASGDAGAVYSGFLDRVQTDRSSVEALQRTLLTAIDDHDQPAIRTAALAILAFVDEEHLWLDGHPPAACFVDTHAAAQGMLTAFGSAADRFVEWSSAGGGLDGAGALGLALDAGTRATDALDAFIARLGETSCPA